VNELDAAGISDPALRTGYRTCRRINAQHGKSYFLATLLLPPAKRPYVHALYGFARYADDLVDTGTPDATAFRDWSQQVLGELEWGASSDPIVRALIDTTRHWNIPHHYVAQFLESMQLDLTVDEYETHDELARYMWGSAAVIGLQLLPILGRADATIGWDVLEPYAIDLGTAFQLTNFIRDVGEDLDRGRIYLPQESLREYGVDRRRLRQQVADEPVRNLVAAEVARTRELYGRAMPGIELVHPTSRDCLLTAVALYGGILDEIERADYDVFARRATVPLTRRAQLGASGLLSAWSSRRTDAPATPTSSGSAGSSKIRTAGLRQVRRRFERR
jgi:15-cis-phytoene synthase